MTLYKVISTTKCTTGKNTKKVRTVLGCADEFIVYKQAYSEDKDNVRIHVSLKFAKARVAIEGQGKQPTKKNQKRKKDSEEHGLV